MIQESELVIKAQRGDEMAIDVLLRRVMPALTRWAHGQRPAGVLGPFETGNLIQKAMFRSIGRLEAVKPGRPGSMQALLRRAVLDRARDDARRVRRRAASVEPDDSRASDEATPLQSGIRREAHHRFGEALLRLRQNDRQLIVARLQLQLTFGQIARRFKLSSAPAARTAFNRAAQRLRNVVH
jgi:RNA polymerase sigma factor (sigma-70 family)